MKTTPNVTYKTTPDGKPITTVSLLQDCLKSMPQGGFDFATIRARTRIADVLEKLKEGEEIKLEDADHAAAVEAIKGTRWVVADKHLIQFAEQFGL